MLIEVMCDKFINNGIPRGKICFHKGLNTVLGSDSGSNSIGKSTFLMIIDFIFGGEDYVCKLADVQHEVGPHTINFAFEFNNEKYYFSRHTVDYTTVHKCDSNYVPLPNGEMDIDDYYLFLQQHYGLDLPGLSFRNAIGRFMRVYKRDTLNEEYPLNQHQKESQKDAVTGLLKLMNLFSQIQDQMLVAKNANEKLAAFKKAQKYALIPFVSKKRDYTENEKRIKQLKEQAQILAKESSAGLLDLDSMQVEQLSTLKTRLSSFKRQKAKLLSQLNAIRLDNEFKVITSTKNYDDLLQFFPNINIKKLDDINTFHKQLIGILKSEFTEAEEALQGTISLIENEIQQIETEIKKSGVATNLTQAILDNYAAIDKELKMLEMANENYNKAKVLSNDAKNQKELYDRLVSTTIAKIQMDLNKKMEDINTEICGANKTSPYILIPDSTHYSFATPRDGGTGSQYKGLVVFDIAMLELSNIPAIVHDSVVLKHIEDDVIEKTLVLYAKTDKQVFIAMDKESSYTEKSQQIMRQTKILQLTAGDGALFGRTWNNRDEENTIQ